jgi:MSHA pilin protein MshC
MVELVTVMVVAAILAAFAAPRFFDVNVFAERGFYEESLTALRYAQKFAMASGCTVTATFTAAGYALSRAGCPDGSSGAVARPGGGGFTGSAPAGVTVSAATIDFDKIGRTSGGALTIGTRPITVEAETGFVH